MLYLTIKIRFVQKINSEITIHRSVCS